jgi:S-adenosylmethionine hydrolase
MNGIITLTTDFGLRDPFVGVMKGQILGRLPDANIVDLTHDIVAHWPVEAGFWLARSYQYFPRGTLHIAVVDPGVGTQREILLIEAEGHVFMAPDNGLLAPLVSRASSAKIFRLDRQRLPHFGIGTPSATFHGRDIFAPIGAEVAANRVRLSSIGVETRDIVPSWVEDPVETPDHVAGAVITIDHFGNLVTNIDAAAVKRFVHPTVRSGAHEFALSRTYGDRKPGEYLALVNSFGVIEIARAEQSAAEGLGLGRGAPVIVTEK